MQTLTESSNEKTIVNSAEYFMAELLSALIWHVHLMSHENLVKMLPEEVNMASMDKETLGKSSANKELKEGKHVEYRRRNDEATEVASKKKETYGSKLVGMTKSLVGAPFRSASKPAADKTPKLDVTFERVNDVFFFDDFNFRSSRLAQLFSALKGLDFRYESFEYNPFAG
ncbi:hypothetical protein RFI_37584 [Reticulomyxa filosa]|uniref:Uncharacterized protein n=1 Tax=Reticulomyxa filosa TaxID=46433 RepID=X6LED7_RETFI|nr:hypothetical protein RFI_37584 [Reticulomyxa filosa]|eukprot:ETN99883.1 hypothetical protein RFI_37584 [Reticulomyxa filosa]